MCITPYEKLKLNLALIISLNKSDIYMLITYVVHFAKIAQNCETKPITSLFFVKNLTIWQIK